MDQIRYDKENFYRKDYMWNRYLLETFRNVTFGFIWGGLISLSLYKMKSRFAITALTCSITGFTISNMQTRLKYNDFTRIWFNENKAKNKIKIFNK